MGSSGRKQHKLQRASERTPTPECIHSSVRHAAAALNCSTWRNEVEFLLKSNKTATSNARLFTCHFFFSCLQYYHSGGVVFPRTQSIIMGAKARAKKMFTKKTMKLVARYCKLCYLKTAARTSTSMRKTRRHGQVIIIHVHIHVHVWRANNLYMYQSFNSCWFNVLHRLNKMTAIRQSVVFALLLRTFDLVDTCFTHARKTSNRSQIPLFTLHKPWLD